MLDKDRYLASLHSDAETLAAAASRDLKAPVPGCPGWDAGILLGHIGLVWFGWTRQLQARGEKGEWLTEADTREWPEVAAWLQRDLDPAVMPPDPGPWARAQAARLEALLAEADPQQPCWTWWPPNQTAGFVMRRMAQETAVHRWDAQSTAGAADPIDGDIAADGIDEMLDIHMPAALSRGEPRRGEGESFHLHRTDGAGEWLVRFDPEGVQVTREHAKGDVAIRGAASDLLLWLWGRIPADRLEVLGDTSLPARWSQLVPPS